MPTLLLRPMRGRDVAEEHRASTPLELFFDLTFVVAVSLAAAGLAHQVEDGHAARGVGIFAMVFFAIWWGWLNFTWFASAYDTDDWLYRVVTLVQMAGSLTVAAGIPRVFDRDDFTVVVVGYVIMRLAMVFQWLRAARGDRERRRTALSYAAGVTIVQILWIARLGLPDSTGVVSFLVLLCLELAVPIVAERHAVTTYHREHIAERYGLFTIIVLGEGVLASGNSIIAAIQDGEHVSSLVVLAIGGLALLAGMWWLYFAGESKDDLDGFGKVFAWGYGHYGIFGAVAAMSAGIEVQVAHVVGEGEVDALTARLAIAVPAASYVFLVWALVLRRGLRAAGHAVLVAGVVVLLLLALVPLSPAVATLLQAVVLAAVVALVVAHQRGRDTAADGPV